MDKDRNIGQPKISQNSENAVTNAENHDQIPTQNNADLAQDQTSENDSKHTKAKETDQQSPSMTQQTPNQSSESLSSQNRQSSPNAEESHTESMSRETPHANNSPLALTANLSTRHYHRMYKNLKPPTNEASLSKWFIDNNPLYLVSVLLMFLGLLLVSGEASTKQVGVQTVALFFGIQNIYEILMVAMGIYLLRSSTNHRHGKILLFFVLLFMTDLTFYQVRISALNATWGFAISLFYLAMGGIKLGLVINMLKITPYWDRLLFPLCAFALIYFAPQYVYHLIDAVGREDKATAAVAFSGVTEIYIIWLLASLIQLPFIVSNWRRSDLQDNTPHDMFGTQQSFYWALLLVPFIALPFQLIKNVMADAQAANQAIADMTFVYAPYLLAGAFFLQSFFQKTIRQMQCQNGLDFMVLMFVVLFSWITWQQGEILGPLGKTNVLLALAGHVAVVITRQNFYSAAFLSMIVIWHFLGWIKAGIVRFCTFLSELSSLAWAGILMTGSFIFLGLGFLLSLKTKRGNLKIAN